MTSNSLLRKGYRACARLTWQHGTTYFWGAALLPRRQRKHVYAVYALCRLADDIVDDTERVEAETPEQTEARLQAFADSFRTSLAAGDSEDPVMAAVVHTVRVADIDPECFDRFFSAMAMDLTQTTYETWDDLCGYMEGSAAVIGEMMLPVLQPMAPEAREPARALGLAFQLTNFLRDVAEDLARGRIYLPLEDLDAFGVREADLGRRGLTPALRELLAFEVRRARGHYRLAREGIDLLTPSSRPCIRAACELYGGILDRIEAGGHDVLGTRVTVPGHRKLAIFARHLLAASVADRTERRMTVRAP
jgi:phytoene synthase